MRIGVALTLVSLLPVADAAGQEAEKRVQSIRAKVRAEGQMNPAIRDAGTGGAQKSPEPELTFVATQDGTAAKAKLGFLLTGRESLYVTLGGPVKSGTASLFDLDGVPNGVEMKVAYQRAVVVNEKDLKVSGEGATAETMGALFEVFGLPSRGTLDEQKSLDLVLRLASVIDRLGGVEMLDALGGVSGLMFIGVAAERSGMQNLGASLAAVQQRTRAELVGELDTARGREAIAAAARIVDNALGLRKITSAVLVSGSYGVARSGFKYVEDGAIVPVETSRTSRTWEVAIGFLRNRAPETEASKPEAGLYMGVSFTGGAGYKAGTASMLCSPYATDSLRCTNIAVGGPVRQGSAELTRLRGDVRFWMAKSRFSVGIRPSYDRVSKERRIEIPLYFIRESKDLKHVALGDAADFNGGVNIGWRSKGGKSDVFAVLFVGASFKLPGLP